MLPPEEEQESNPESESSKARFDSGAIELDEHLEVLPPEEETDLKSVEPEQSTDLIRYDPLSAYLRDIRRYPRLSREEEQELALRYFHEQDLDAAYKLVKANLWLVVKIARDYERAARSLLDLIQEGNIGLMEAVKNFDPFRGVRFPSYAVWWIKAYIVRFVIANWRMVKIGTTQAQRKLFFNLQKEKEKLEREGFFPGPKLLAKRLDVKESEVIEMEQRLGSMDLSIDAPASSESDATFQSLLPAADATAEELVSKKQLQDLLRRHLEEFQTTLNEKEEAIFEDRLLSEEKVTLQVLADRLGVSRERIRQIEGRVKEKLRDFLIDKMGSIVDPIDFSFNESSD